MITIGIDRFQDEGTYLFVMHTEDLVLVRCTLELEPIIIWTNTTATKCASFLNQRARVLRRVLCQRSPPVSNVIFRNFFGLISL